jgi:alkanesulfonate monooxygenase SsuD/methylene tetrahydromethanopterin reductase-like flavin-dependent oxidoreductase (luciferase family)
VTSAQRRPRVGFVPVGRSLPQLRSAVQVLESLGVDSLWAPGHIATGREVPETMTGLATLAAVSERATIGTSILLAPLYHPVIVAKQAAELDRLTGGRVALGLGVGPSTRRSSGAARSTRPTGGHARMRPST